MRRLKKASILLVSAVISSIISFQAVSGGDPIGLEEWLEQYLFITNPDTSNTVMIELTKVVETTEKRIGYYNPMPWIPDQDKGVCKKYPSLCTVVIQK